MNIAKEVTLEQAGAFLTDQLSMKPTDLALVGEGAWSRCFGFRQGNEELVIRFGHYVDDFQKDQLAHLFNTPELPIAEVRAIGSAFGGYYAVSTRAHGIPLEQVEADQWRALVPALVDALEAMRTADLSTTLGFGGWGKDGNGSLASWSRHLLAVDIDTPARRTYGWRKRLATVPEGEAAFTWGYKLLQQLASDDVPRNLLHCDLINRNVLVDGAKLSGVFDWGCSIYGDHLYELAWFEFWAPWMPQLDIAYLREALAQRWREVGYAPHNQAARLATCYLHIGLDHLAYNAYTGDWETLKATARQMHLLVKE